MFDMMQLLGKMKEVQAKLKEAQENLANITETAEAGAGMVKATVNGKKQVIKLEIDNDIINVDDKEMMQDLIIAAINKALQDVEVLAREEIKKNTSGILPNIPGLDLSNIM
ncbi:MAG: YbaB/EbfC family nucleoid-associated protein [Bacteroidetes bacterium]|nr:YbaB/EbfC family nucleoid-associated protein [Bacteroidota bacterium]MCH8231246.1 YbaB/EbfC family nucleoid-associated protein [Bacteroidota bacterium]